MARRRYRTVFGRPARYFFRARRKGKFSPKSDLVWLQRSPKFGSHKLHSALKAAFSQYCKIKGNPAIQGPEGVTTRRLAIAACGKAAWHGPGAVGGAYADAARRAGVNLESLHSTFQKYLREFGVRRHK
ncbi:hypothetical protein B6U74_06310 [Candidatus Bathyarchaeota archaeon ex4484_205]|nr:MAG: hypothetical protein B6U74_06310 [Candidatus Bathyarchaeota archaeon ex4484_205]